jgi:hypothetical protein
MHYDVGGRVSARLHPLDGFSVRISENARKFTVFFGSPHPGKDGKTVFGGTGFLVLFVEEGSNFPYLVTARHVAQRVQPDETFVRVNNKDGKTSVPVVLDDVRWAYHPDPSVDVAVTPSYLNPADWDVAYYNLADRVQPSSSPYRVQHGDDICIVGLFHWHSGQDRNVPIVHCGTVALLPDENEKVLIKNRTSGLTEKVEVYLVEAQTFEGLSGAPVFQREPVALRMLGEHNGGPAIALTGTQLRGVYSGAWEGEPSEALMADRKWSPDRRIPAGMGLVMPAERIVETIMSDPELKKRRADAIRKKNEGNAAVMDSSLPASDANPNHKSDFDSLLVKAVRQTNE